MADTVFDYAKNGMLSCAVQDIRLHSAYDPQKEADRFISDLNPDFIPSAIIVIEPALSYCAQQLRKSFPQVKIGAIRFSDDFSDSDTVWDFVIKPEKVSQSLLSLLGETILPATLFVSWKPSERAFPDISASVWHEIRKALKTATDILGTRAYFAKRWIKNTCRFCFSVKRTAVITKGTMPIVIAASGPSLEKSLPYIKQYRRNFFLMAVSSAYGALLAAEIQPDVCISTDGGYWATKHIERCSVPLIVSAESAVPLPILEQEIIIPIQYNDGPESILLKECNITALQGKRNGTVSGTAAELAFTLTDGPVFACGLDLATSVGLQHAKPNTLEIGNSCRDYRLKPAHTRLYPTEFENGSLAVYRNWFSAQQGNFQTRFFRLADAPYEYKNVLGNIKTICWQDFKNMLTKNANHAHIKPQIHNIENFPDCTKRYNSIKSFFSDNKNINESDIWLSALVPAEFVLHKRDKDSARAQTVLKEKVCIFTRDIRDYINRWRNF